MTHCAVPLSPVLLEKALKLKILYTCLPRSRATIREFTWASIKPEWDYGDNLYIWLGVTLPPDLEGEYIFATEDAPPDFEWGQWAQKGWFVFKTSLHPKGWIPVPSFVTWLIRRFF